MVAEDADAEGAAGVADECGEPALVGFVVVAGAPAPLFEGGVEDEFVEPAALEDLVDALEFVAVGEVVGGRAFGRSGILGRNK